MEKLGAFLEDLQTCFIDGRLEDMLKRVSLPLVVYSIAGVMLLRTEAEFIQTLGQYRAAIVALSVTSSTVEIREFDAPQNQRLRATVRVTDFDADGREVTSSLIRYFLIESGESYLIEMMEYLESPLSREEVERIVH